ncbi:acyl-CoA dehydrogenase [Acrocarpospora pleiomorpha]|uniref:Acyl-CoA dehydrogenase n=1 Tax=Acrocarpospora pleiomorpha TaxID=90975 RepID=A0A5M3XE50_9ACTN|nr:acyl-CoA dehydrogenase family protein [Acrocarpospora pleiomorpha]GES19544.1 acyl-CoA dehydrogenase [Acrocarpospora pleiomorpha]
MTAALRAEAATWLREHAPRFEPAGPGPLSPFEVVDEAEEPALVELARRWQRHKFEAGWAALSLPPELGGRGLSRADDVMFTDEEARFHVPTHVLEVTTRMVLPTLVHWSPEKRASIEGIISGRDMWCQLFSEPDAGSDLAALRTRATRRTDGTWTVTGQKVWTSWAHLAQRGYLLARTGADGHGGLTAFELDMAAPGVSIRRIRQATGASTFNEVFLDQVPLPAEAPIGPVGQGWAVAMTTLMNERLAVGADQIPYDELRAEAVRRGLLNQPDVAAALGALRARRIVLEQLRQQMVRSVRRGGDPGPEGSAAKLFLAESVFEAARFARRLVGGDLVVDDRWSRLALAWPGIKNAGGTDEIQKTIIANRILGLPKEP